jgi:hypothetical protein
VFRHGMETGSPQAIMTPLFEGRFFRYRGRLRFDEVLAASANLQEVTISTHWPRAGRVLPFGYDNGYLLADVRQGLGHRLLSGLLDSPLPRLEPVLGSPDGHAVGLPGARSS